MHEPVYLHSELKTRKSLAKAGTPTGQVAKQLGRPRRGSTEGQLSRDFLPGGQAAPARRMK